MREDLVGTKVSRSISDRVNNGDWRAMGEFWRHRQVWIICLALFIVISVYGGRAILANARGPAHLVVYAFSTQEEAFTQSIFPTFEQAWEAETGRDLTIEGVFGPSGLLVGQINLGAPADVAVLSNAQHITWLKVGRRVRQDTQSVVVGSTPMVIVVRPGNPAGILDFADLGQPGLRLLHAEPGRSGAGDWSVLAEYGSAWLESGDKVTAEAQLKSIWRNVRLLGSSARASLTLFELGAGDALVTYEQDARLALERGVALEIVVPPRTMVAQHVAVIVDDNVTAVERPAAQAFVRYLLSDEGQQIFSDFHLRPVEVDNGSFPEIFQPFTVADLGGWSLAYVDLVETLWLGEIEPGLDLEAARKLMGQGE